MPASSNSRFGATYLRFENLYRPGDCPSRIAVFFRRAGVMQHALAERAPAWTPTADLWKVTYPVPALIPVTVHVNNPPADADEDIQFAQETFGSANRTGIQLQFTPTGACPETTPAAPNIRLCYIDDGGLSEATVPTSRVIKVQVDRRAKSTVAHFLGRVLGLPTANPPGAQAYFRNIMQPTPTDRDPNLTLGQVYHINVGLGSLPPCDAVPCPSLMTNLLPP
jgi:hypothetical protein